MTTNKQLRMAMRDMLFITWAVEPDVVRRIVDQRLELDTRADSNGRAVAFVSAVCFHVTEVSSGALPLPSLSFRQVNYRAYVRAGELPAVCFLEMKVNSRMVTALTSLMNVPVSYEDIDISTAPGGAGLSRYSISSAGLRAEATIESSDPEASLDDLVAPQFITDRVVGFAGAAGGMFRINLDQPLLDSVSARIHKVQPSGLEQLGLLTPGQSAQPCSVLYVRDGSFGADAPVREW